MKNNIDKIMLLLIYLPVFKDYPEPSHFLINPKYRNPNHKITIEIEIAMEPHDSRLTCF